MRRLIAALLVVTATAAGAQTPQSPVQQSGPLILNGGPSAQVLNADFTVPADHVFKVVWELNVHADSSQVNQQVGTIARFYNLHARHGVAKENLHAAAIVHGTAWMAMLTDEAYERRYGRANPSKALVQELIATGARFAVCGQTAAFRGVRADELLPGVQLAISAMTALSVFYAEGYHLQPWR